MTLYIRLRQQIKNMDKRKADPMSPAATKLSPPDKQEKTKMSREYDEEEVNKPQPDRPSTPPPDYTGHIVSVLADTPGGKINSEPVTSPSITTPAAKPESEQQKQPEEK